MKVRHFLSAWLCGIAISASAAADDKKLPLLKDTLLYTQTAIGCRGIELNKDNPYVKILAKYKIEYFDIEMCNEGEYPILHPNLRFDPVENSKYNYTDFFKDLVRENGYSPLSIIDEQRGKILNLSWVKPRDLHIETELYDAQ
jgi:hypothetical protein